MGYRGQHVAKPASRRPRVLTTAMTAGIAVVAAAVTMVAFFVLRPEPSPSELAGRQVSGTTASAGSAPGRSRSAGAATATGDNVAGAGVSAGARTGGGTPAGASTGRATRSGEQPSAAASTPTGRLLPAALTHDQGGGASRVPYRVEVEEGLGYEPDTVAARVAGILEDPRGWQAVDNVDFVPVGQDEQAEIVVTLASPALTDELCAPLQTSHRLSCWRDGRAVLNSWRWGNGADSYPDDLAGYRMYLVNHEVGHGLGHYHLGCPGPGRKAPVMLQQTKGLQGCAPNPWPAEDGER